MKQTLIILFVLLVLTLGCTQQQTVEQAIQTTTLQQQTQTSGQEQAETTPPDGSVGQTIKEFSITASRFKFEPDLIEVNQGDKITITAESVEGLHGFAIDEYNVNIALNPGEPVTTSFTANKVGTFTFYCSIPCGKGHSSMKGMLVVREK